MCPVNERERSPPTQPAPPYTPRTRTCLIPQDDRKSPPETAMCGPHPPLRRLTLPLSTCCITLSLVERVGVVPPPSAFARLTSLPSNKFSDEDSNVSRPSIDDKVAGKQHMSSTNPSMLDKSTPPTYVTFSPATALHPLNPDTPFSTVHEHHPAYDG